MIRIRWPVALATLFLVLFGWYLIYTQSLLVGLNENQALTSEVFSIAQELIQDTAGAETSGAGGRLQDVRRFENPLFELQEVIIRSGIPMIWMSPADSVLSVENLPFDTDIFTPEGQELVKAHVRGLHAAGREPLRGAAGNLLAPLLTL